MQQATTTILSNDVEQSLVRLEAVAKLMDGAIVIPGTDLRIGLDAVIGIVPGIGDLISGAIGSYLIWEARRLGASRVLIARMAANTTIDTVLGSMRPCRLKLTQYSRPVAALICIVAGNMPSSHSPTSASSSQRYL